MATEESPDLANGHRIVAVGFLGRRHGPDREQVTTLTTTALVVEAAAPPEGGPSLGPGSNGPLRIMADLGSGRRLSLIHI